MGGLLPPINLALTLGDPTGIGVEITLKALARIALLQNQLARKLYRLIHAKKLTISIVGSRIILQNQLKTFSVTHHQTLIPLKNLFSFSDNHTLTVQTQPVAGNPAGAALKFQFYPEEQAGLVRLKPGTPSRTSGQHALALLKRGCKLIATKTADALVTAPLSKEIIARFTPRFVGHTEYLETYFKQITLHASKHGFLGQVPLPATPKQCPKVSMGFVAPDFNLMLMTRHLALRHVSKHLTLEAIERTLHHASLLAALTLDPPKRTQRVEHTKSKPTQSPIPLPIAVLALNPHGGEGGLFGAEEQNIAKAIQLASQTPLMVSSMQNRRITYAGPLSADTAFLKIGRNKPYQHVVACYHDQGLIPLKTSAGLCAANVTLGLPFIRTSVDHGTAFDIAGKNLADETSFLYALYQAWRLQTNYQTLSKTCVNPT